MRSTIPRLLAAAGASTLILSAGFAAPAHADDSSFFFADLLPEAVSVAPSPGKAMQVAVGASNVTNPRFTIDTTGLLDEATADTPDGCTSAAAKITCQVPTATDLQFSSVWLIVHPTAKAAVGDTLHVTITSQADNISTFTQTYEIKMADAVDLVASPALIANSTNALGTVHPGEHVTAKAGVSNVGSKVAQGIRVTVTSDHALAPDQFDNCEYGAVNTYLHQFVCDLPDVVLNPGDGPLALVDELGKDVGFTITPDAGGPAAGAEIVFDALADAPALPSQLKLAKPAHTGHALRLVAVAQAAARAANATPADANADDNLTEAFWNLAGIHTDVAAIGARARAKVGDTVDVNVGFVDNGPASLDALRSGGDPAFVFIFIPPANTDVVAAPQSCESITDNPDGSNTGTRGAPHGTYYQCGSASFVPVGAPQTTKITLKVIKGGDDKGQVTFADKYRNPDFAFHDDNPADDQADVLVGPAVDTGNTGGGSGGGNVLTSLPVTGAPLALIAIVGVAIVAGGVVLLRLGRRRDRV
jgi:hypothetical protein